MDEPNNPYTQLEGYRVKDASGEEVGEIEDTVYDAPSDVLKYVVVRARPIPAERIEVHVEEQTHLGPLRRGNHRVGAGDGGNLGAFDDAVREHYG